MEKSFGETFDVLSLRLEELNRMIGSDWETGRTIEKLIERSGNILQPIGLHTEKALFGSLGEPLPH